MKIYQAVFCCDTLGFFISYKKAQSVIISAAKKENLKRYGQKKLLMNGLKILLKMAMTIGMKHILWKKT